MRTTAEECAELGRRIARELSGVTCPTALFLPLGGVSRVDAPGQPFHDAEADAALFDALRDGLGGRAGRARSRTSTTRPSPVATAKSWTTYVKGERMTGDVARAKLRETLDGGGPIIGAGAGTGLSGRARRPAAPT